MAKDRKTAGGKAEMESAAEKSRAKTPAKKATVKKSTPAKSVAKKSAPAKAPAKKAAARSAAKKAPPPAKIKSAPAKKSAAKTKKPAKKRIIIEPVEVAEQTTRVPDAIGDLSDGEAQSSSDQMEAYRADTSADAEEGLPEVDLELEEGAAAKTEDVEERAFPSEPRGEGHLERLQKILSQAGIASRRHAEEMIQAGRVIVNGQVITQLGAKADPDRDHIRVDNKLIQRAERHRTFVLNKPRGYVTTVSDPEGRPTVADLFSKFRERLYPVGRLDFQSEGLLLMTNDGELANLLTRASSGVEKTYVVKIAGQLTAEQLDRLREGVSIEKGEQGSKRVRTAPAEIRQIRPGENPWYEVILIEGRNREIRKMFSTTGHFVEKIRRVGYGPLVLDVEPGKFRELTPDELNALRMTAEGKMKPKRPRSSALLPKEAGIPTEERRAFRGKQRGGDRFRGGAPGREQRPFGQRGSRPSFGQSSSSERRGPERKEFGGSFEKRPFPREGKPFERRERPSFRPEAGFPREEGAEKREGRFDQGDRKPFARGDRKPFERGERRPFDRGQSKPFNRGERKPFDREREGGERAERPFRGGGPRREFGGPRPGAGQRFGSPRPASGERSGPRREFDGPRPGGGERERGERTFGDRPRFDRKPRFESRESSNRGGEREERPRRESRPREEGGDKAERPNRFGDRPFRPQGGRPQSGGKFERRPGSGGRPKFGGPRSGGSRPGGFRGKPGGGPRGRDRG